MTEAINVEVLRAELMRFSKEELVTELLAALLELAGAENGAPNRRTSAHSSTHRESPTASSPGGSALSRRLPE
jgi:hypothetical protein